MGPDADELKRQRATARGKVTRKVKQFKKSLLERKSCALLEIHFCEIDEAFQDLEKIH